MPELQSIRMLVFVYLVALFYGCQLFCGLLFATIVKGPKRIFRVNKRSSRPEILDNPDFGTHNFARLKNIMLHYVAKGDESKPLMLFLHGFPEIWYEWRHALKEFSNTHRAVAVDMRGYGESQKPSSVSEYTLDKLAGDVKALVAGLGYEKCILVGHDWGGLVAVAVAQLYPTIIDKLVVVNVPHYAVWQNTIHSSFAQFRKSWYVFAFQLALLPEIVFRAEDLKFLEGLFTEKPWGAKPGTYTEDDIEVNKYSLRNYEDLKCLINYYRAAWRYKPTVHFTNIDVPTQFIWGTADAALGKELAELSGKYISNLRIDYLEGISHWSPSEEPEKVNKLIHEFIEDKKLE